MYLIQRVAPRSPQPDSRIPWGGTPLGKLGTGDGCWGTGDWVLGTGEETNPQSPIPNPQSPLHENCYNFSLMLSGRRLFQSCVR
ncbi:hypothetical protein SD81_006880 [Tolypothrix campylonemoides VB511288]|nr:hypothetical protein SD81_006880 [Tolypothrix campylonemoides VB511288]